ncbi:MAG: TonB-dependent receptor, partial [Candidatus Omnitrophica bacterium]|nr:TonB-dependent receptor [Candidatus Omnitrophota bacterium]
KLEFAANYTWQNPEFSGGINDGNDIPLVPRQMATSSLVMQFLDYFYLSFTGRYIGSRFILNDIANEITPAKPYYVVDMKLAYKRKYIELWAAINNLFDEQYAAFEAKKTLTLKDIYPAPEQNFLFGINFQF